MPNWLLQLASAARVVLAGQEMVGGTTSLTEAVTELVPIQPLSFTVTKYVPLAAGVAFAMLGLDRPDVKLFGPVQE